MEADMHLSRTLLCSSILFLTVTISFSACGREQKPAPPSRVESVRAYTAEELAEVQKTTNGSLTAGDKAIVYVNDKAGALELWYRPLNGQPEQITDLKEQVVEPRVSPDGEVVVFGSDFGGDE